jgi:hypothetical protein
MGLPSRFTATGTTMIATIAMVIGIATDAGTGGTGAITPIAGVIATTITGTTTAGVTMTAGATVTATATAGIATGMIGATTIDAITGADTKTAGRFGEGSTPRRLLFRVVG